MNQTLTEHEGRGPIRRADDSELVLEGVRTERGKLPADPNAIVQTFIVEAADAEHKLEVVEKDANGFGASEKESAETVEVPKPAAPPMTQSPRDVQPEGPSVPTISGSAVQGATLTSHPASWSQAPTGFEYQWKRCEGERHAMRADRRGDVDQLLTGGRRCR